MKKIAYCFLLIIFVFAAVSSAQSNNGKTAPKITKTASDIRKIDFKNFNYGALCAGTHMFLPIEPSEKLVLRKGHDGDEANYADLGSVKYVDFDGDGIEEAFVTIKGQTSGSSNSFLSVFIFAFRNGAARRIWSKCEENSSAELKDHAILFTYPDWLKNDAHCCFSYVATDTYGWKNSKIALISKKRKATGGK